MALTRAAIAPADVTNAGGPSFSNALVNQINNLSENVADRNGVASDETTITLAAAAGTSQVATIQVKDGLEANVAAVQRLEVYMCTDAAGATPSSSGAGTSATVTTGALLKAHTAKLHLEVLTDATGKAAITFNNASGGAAYTDRIAVVLPNGKVVVSAALAVPNA